MKLFRFKKSDQIAYGVVANDHVQTIHGSIFDAFTMTKAIYALAEVEWLPPCEPTKIVAIGRNYREHAKEMGHDVPAEPLLFIKPSTAVIGTKQKVILPPISKRVDFEGEVGVVIKKKAYRLGPQENPMDYVLGYTGALDITARDLQKQDVQFTRAKGFDTFAPIGPWIETALNPKDIGLQTWVNGELRQSGSTRDLIFPIDYLIRFITEVMTLLPGDVIFTGTPAGVGPLSPGDAVELRIQELGTLAVNVAMCPCPA
ncbi:MAG: fumarylacetoacetate hydrolase family protein [Acidobacteria bacterium]|nr:fumarylacetoacetate hydrolase family protein [Acidobacteriota bacterium]MBI3657886.1 fumarylacetoacetate hydrolase family protein [Acidobacteriota bacterium]